MGWLRHKVSWAFAGYSSAPPNIVYCFRHWRGFPWGFCWSSSFVFQAQLFWKRFSKCCPFSNISLPNHSRRSAKRPKRPFYSLIGLARRTSSGGILHPVVVLSLTSPAAGPGGKKAASRGLLGAYFVLTQLYIRYVKKDYVLFVGEI